MWPAQHLANQPIGVRLTAHSAKQTRQIHHRRALFVSHDIWQWRRLAKFLAPLWSRTGGPLRAPHFRIRRRGIGSRDRASAAARRGLSPQALRWAKTRWTIQ